LVEADADAAVELGLWVGAGAEAGAHVDLGRIGSEIAGGLICAGELAGGPR